MDSIEQASKKLKTVADDFIARYQNVAHKLDEEEEKIKKRFEALEEKKAALLGQYGNPNATEHDLIEINAGGRVIAAKRGTLCQIKGSRLEGLFSGLWDKQLQRDGDGRVFLDVYPEGFQAVVDYLNELAISPPDDPPKFPVADHEENQCMVDSLLHLFSLKPSNGISGSMVITDPAHASLLHDWLKAEDSDGGLRLLYRSTRDGFSSEAFHSRCDGQGSTLSIIEATNGAILGGFSNVSWKKHHFREWEAADKAFLFSLCREDISSCKKMKQISRSATGAMYHNSQYGPSFGGGTDLLVRGNELSLNPYTYESSQWCAAGKSKAFEVKEVEVYAVGGSHNEACHSSTIKQKSSISVQATDSFASDINNALNDKLKTIQIAEKEICQLEGFFEQDKSFVDLFANENIEASDIIRLNVSGASMATKRSTLQACKDSILSAQFDDAKWTEQGLEGKQVEEWTSDEVTSWVKDIRNIPGSVADLFAENSIAGNELLALKKDGLVMLGIERTGTLCLLLDEIEKLKKSSEDIISLIEHSPYCFAKILDYLRAKQLHSQGLAEAPQLPVVRKSEKSRFEKVVKYFFPGDSSKQILG